jgi:hypothetical protein
MDRYFELCRRRRRPTEEQCLAYVEHLSQAHTWWKHLPLIGEGEPFNLHLAPNGHRAEVERLDGTVAFRPIERYVKDSFWEVRVVYEEGDVALPREFTMYEVGRIDTQMFEENFGTLSYWNRSPPDEPREHALAAARAGLFVQDDDLSRVDIPESVLDAGLVYLRATLSGHLGRRQEEYDLLRPAGQDLPDAVEDAREQKAKVLAAIGRVLDLTHG